MLQKKNIVFTKMVTTGCIDVKCFDDEESEILLNCYEKKIKQYRGLMAFSVQTKYIEQDKQIEKTYRYKDEILFFMIGIFSSQVCGYALGIASIVYLYTLYCKRSQNAHFPIIVASFFTICNISSFLQLLSLRVIPLCDIAILYNYSFEKYKKSFKKEYEFLETASATLAIVTFIHPTIILNSLITIKYIDQYTNFISLIINNINNNYITQNIVSELKKKI
jgi:hypothetical protein